MLNWLLSVSLFLQSRKHANKVRLYYMLHPVDGGCPAKKLRTDNVSLYVRFLSIFFANTVVNGVSYHTGNRAIRPHLCHTHSTPF